MLKFVFCLFLNCQFVTFAGSFLLSAAWAIAGTSSCSSLSQTARIWIQKAKTSQPQDNVRRVRRTGVARIYRSDNDTFATYYLALLHGWVSSLSMRVSQREASNVHWLFACSTVASEGRVHDALPAITNTSQGWRAKEFFWLCCKAKTERFVRNRCGLLHFFIHFAYFPVICYNWYRDSRRQSEIFWHVNGHARALRITR